MDQRNIGGLFDAHAPSGKPTDDVFQTLKDPGDDAQLRAARQFCEDMWSTYSRDADQNFLADAPIWFQPRFWEMYLTCSLRNLTRMEVAISCLKPGPDVLLEAYGRKIWIEAICATNGRARDSVPPPSHSKATPAPDDQLILRHTSAVREKHRKFVDYRKTLVSSDDATVIAVNTGELHHRFATSYPPRMVRALFPIGEPFLNVARSSGKVIDSGYLYRPHVLKKNNTPVPTDGFLTEDWKDVSAVLCSNTIPFLAPGAYGADFILVHNPRARIPIEPGVIPVRREFALDGDSLIDRPGTLSN